MEKILSRVSFIGGIIIVFLGVGMMLMEGANAERSEAMKITLMTLLFITGGSTMLHVMKSGLGKGNPD